MGPLRPNPSQPACVAKEAFKGGCADLNDRHAAQTAAHVQSHERSWGSGAEFLAKVFEAGVPHCSSHEREQNQQGGLALYGGSGPNQAIGSAGPKTEQSMANLRKFCWPPTSKSLCNQHHFSRWRREGNPHPTFSAWPRFPGLSVPVGADCVDRQAVDHHP
jgi:hypothetical protein